MTEESTFCASVDSIETERDQNERFLTENTSEIQQVAVMSGEGELNMSLIEAKEVLLKDLKITKDPEKQEDAQLQSPMDVEVETTSISKPIELSANLLASLELGEGNFFKGCKWAPDGLCLMTCSEDNVIRLINTPSKILAEKQDRDFGEIVQMDACLKIKEAEIIYDYVWWPLMNSSYPETCCFVTTAKDQPVHLWDAFNGDLRASYIPKNHVDEVHAAHCINFSPDGLQMICGFAKELRLFYIDRPGTSCEIWPTRKHKKASGQRGIISTTEFSPDGATIACGSYDGTTALYSSKNGELVGIFNSKSKGVTHVKFSTDGNRLYSGSRKGNSIVCWDVRYMAGDVFNLDRTVETNQRIYFDFAPKTLPKKDMVTEDLIISGGTDGVVSFWDMAPLLDAGDATELQDPAIDPIFTFSPHRDCVNGVNFHPWLPVLATGSGQRHAIDISDSDEDSSSNEMADDETDFEENCLKLWQITGLNT